MSLRDGALHAIKLYDSSRGANHCASENEYKKINMIKQLTDSQLALIKALLVRGILPRRASYDLKHFGY